VKQALTVLLAEPFGAVALTADWQNVLILHFSMVKLHFLPIILAFDRSNLAK